MAQESMSIAFVVAKNDAAQAAVTDLRKLYTEVPLEQADVIVALGGDGSMLRTLHRYLSLNKPVYGMKLGTVGFLMNQFHPTELMERIARAQPTLLKPLVMQAISEAGTTTTSLAFNAGSLL